MAAPNYGKDLTDINLGTGTWVELTGATAGGVPAAETDYFIEGTQCMSKDYNATGLGACAIDLGSPITITSGMAVLTWVYWECPNTLANLASGGMRIAIGSSVANYRMWYVFGSDTYVYGGWQNIAVDPTVSGNSDYGTPTGSTQVFGCVANNSNKVAKGNPFGVDAIRWGRSLIITGGATADGYATFSGAATKNDYNDATNGYNRWGLFQAVTGGYLQKGLFLMGLATSTTATRARSSNTATLTTGAAHGLRVGDVVVVTGLGGTGYNVTAAVTVVGSTTSFSYANTGDNESQTADTGGTVSPQVDFRDSNRNIFIQDTTKVAAAFNEFEVRNASSRVDWTGIQITALGTTSPGKFTTTHNADINFDTCIFNDMNTFVFMSNATILNTTFRRCGLVTQGGGTFTNCWWDSATGAVSLYCDDPDLITNSRFTSDGSNHAMELTTACAGNSYDLVGCTFTGYDSGNGGSNAVIYNNSGGAVTINVYDCTGTVSYKNGTDASTTIVSGSVNFSVTVKDTASPPAAIVGAKVLLAAADASGPMPYRESVTIVRSGSTATVTHTGHGMDTNDKVEILGSTAPEYNSVHTITKINDDSYSYTVSGTPETPAPGTITATYVALFGDTDSNGQVSSSRVFSSDQNVSGWARKSSAAPFYQSGNIVGTIDSTDGFSATIQLLPDQ